MKNKLRFLSLFAIAATIGFTACSDESDIIEAEPQSSYKINISGEITQVYQTRVNDAGFCNGDEVGIYVVDYNGSAPGQLLDEGNRADNVKHTFDEANYKWTSAYEFFFKDKKTNVDIYGYYPFANPDNVSAYAFEVQKDQSTTAAYGKIGGYEASDFLWGKAQNIAPTDKVIKLGFRHMMASARVTLAEGTGFAEGEWGTLEKAVLMLNTKREATINLSTGEVTAVGNVPSTGTIPYANGGDYRAIIVPQTVAANTPLVSITVGGTPYLLKKGEAFTYAASKQHNFTITVNKREGAGYEFVLTSESITAWENDGVSHDATAREYIVINVPKAGTLDACIAAAGKDLEKVRNLKLTGEINSRDFAVMNFKMLSLASLNLQEVEITSGEYGYIEPGPDPNDGYINLHDAHEANCIPNYAFCSNSRLLRIVLPNKLEKIGREAFFSCSNLTGSLIIPEGVVEIGQLAFRDCWSLTGTLSLPSTLKKIDSHGFLGCGFTCELVLPDNLTYIGDIAFGYSNNLYGSLNFPDKLTYLGAEAFRGCGNLSGNIEIPQNITDIKFATFDGAPLRGTLKLHDGIKSIGAGAFNMCGLRGELNLPKDLVVINNDAFAGCDFSGILSIPKDVAVIGQRAFAYNWRLMGKLEIPKSVHSIGASAFESCSGIEGIVFEDGIENVGQGAFNMCTGIGSIVCKSNVPAYVHNGAFDGVPKDNFTLEVPESAIAQYQAAAGWNEFKRISAYRNLAIRPMVATAINTSATRNLVLNADDEWEVESKPDWIALDKTSGKGKAELKLTFAEMQKGSAPREGEVVFKLVDKDYRTRCKVTQYDYDYAEDEILTLQKASTGKGINVVFLGDGYNAKEISEGKMLDNINEAVKHFFNIEPYKTYRDYFNVYTGIAVSPESGVGGVNTIIHNRFNTTAKGGVTLGGRNADGSDYEAIFEYACKAPTVSADNINETLIVMIPNTKEYGGICYMYDEGAAIAYCPMSDYGYPLDFRGVIQHEAGGHGFAKLGDEYIYHNAFIDACPCSCCGHVDEFNMAKAMGWYENLSLTGHMHNVPWSHLIFHEKYNQIVDIFEGGFMHTRGVFRSEQNSCMNNNIPYYSTISRETIVKRIKAIAGEVYSFEDFVANDVLDAGTVESASRNAVPEYIARPAMHRSSPVFMGKLPKINAN